MIGINTQIIFTFKFPPFHLVTAQEISADRRGTPTSYSEILSNRMKNGQNEAILKILRGPHRSKRSLNKRKYYPSLFPRVL